MEFVPPFCPNTACARHAEAVAGCFVRHGLYAAACRSEPIPRAPRTTHNPLFVVNTTLAMTRDNCGRLQRKSWLVTKKREFLRLQMQQFFVCRNYACRRFNHDKKEDQSPAVRLQLIPRSQQIAAAIRWRQDRGQGSLHPLCATGSRRIRDQVAAVA